MTSLALQIAQTTPPSGFSSFVENGFYIVGLITAVVVLYRQLRPAESQPLELKGQPLTVKAADDFVTTPSFDALKEDVENLRGEVRDGFDKLGEERRVSVGNLHGKVDSTNAKVDEMRGEVRLLNQQLQQILQRQLK